jgi:hypothetical protein
MEKNVFDKSDSTYGYYLAFRPQSNKIKGTLLVITSFGTPENLLSETKLHNVAYANDILTVYLSVGHKVYADAVAIGKINRVAQSIFTTYAVDTARMALAGYDFAGNIALRYAELANEHPASYMLHPKAVFAVDAPVDLFGFWQRCEKQIQKNYYQGAVWDAKFLLEMMTKENGAITAKPDVYRQLSPFYREATAAGHEQFLGNTALRLYYDNDVEWQLTNRRNSLYDTNIPEGSELISRLLLQGSKKAELVLAKKAGVRSNGQRNPNSLSIVDEVDCIHWLKKSLDIFDPLTWQAPYKLPVPDGWTTEHFPLPPDFAPSFSFKGVEEIRFHPGWGDTASKGYWTYAYLWWLDGVLTISEAGLQQNLQAYYAGLVSRNIEPRKIPANKVIPTEVVIKKVKPIANDAATFSGTIRMLDYMAQKPMVLNCLIHVKNAGIAGKSAVLIEVSPQPATHEVWKQMDAIGDGFVSPAK